MQLERVGPYLWRIPRDERLGMRVPGLVVADETLLAAIRSDASLEQLANGATLPGSFSTPHPVPMSAIGDPSGTQGDVEAVVSPDCSTIYLVSDRAGTKGGLDLWAADIAAQ